MISALELELLKGNDFATNFSTLNCDFAIGAPRTAPRLRWRTGIKDNPLGVFKDFANMGVAMNEKINLFFPEHPVHELVIIQLEIATNEVAMTEVEPKSSNFKHPFVRVVVQIVITAHDIVKALVNKARITGVIPSNDGIVVAVCSEDLVNDLGIAMRIGNHHNCYHS